MTELSPEEQAERWQLWQAFRSVAALAQHRPERRNLTFCAHSLEREFQERYGSHVPSKPK